MPDPATEALAASYKIAASLLRGAHRRSRWDASIAQRRNSEVRYIFDTNVFLFHANILEQRSQSQDLAALLGVQPTDPFLCAMERLTSEYLFSGQLPGQPEPTAYISSQHFGEAIAKAEHLEQTLVDRVRPIGFEEGLPQVQRRIRDLLARGSAEAGGLEEIQRLVPAAWLNALRTREHFRSSVEKAFLGKVPQLTPLHHTAWGWSAGNPIKADVDRWRDLLSGAKGSLTRNLDHDAATLATIVDLYRNDRTSRFDDRTHLYLFVTADPVIAKVVNDELSALKAEGIPYFVRTPRDYLPLLNIDAMTQVYGDRDRLHQDQLEAVSQVLDGALDWVAFEPDSTKLVSGDEGRSPVTALQEAWRDVSELSTILNARYFEASNRELFAGLTDFVSENYAEGLENATLVMGRVKRQHVTAVLDSAITAAHRYGVGQGGVLTRRAQLKPIGSGIFEDYIGARKPNGLPESVADFVDRAVTTGVLDRTVEAHIRDDPDQPAAMMLVACLFLAAENWSEAADFAMQALANTAHKPSSVLQVEASYLRALCLRFSMRSDQDFLKASRALTRNLQFYRQYIGSDNQFRRLRDQIEMSTLYISSSIMQAILESRSLPRSMFEGTSSYVPRNHVDHYFTIGFNTAYTSLVELVMNFSVALDDAEHRHHELAHSLHLQATTNLAGAWVFSKALTALQSRSPTNLKDVHRNLKRLIDDAQEAKRPLRETQRLFHEILDFLDDEGPTRWDAAQRALQWISRTRHAHMRQPINDRIRFEFLDLWIRGQLPVSA